MVSLVLEVLLSLVLKKSNHHECFTVDEAALQRGAAVAAQFAFDFLGGK